MSGVSKRKFLYFKLYINNLSKSRETVRTPTNITTGTNILKLDPGIYSYEDSNASDEQKLAMGFPKAMWHSEITVTGYWADNNKSTGYINIVVRDCNGDTPCIYENLYGWTGWRGWQSYALKSDLNARFMDMSDFTIEKIKSIYDANIPIVGYINYTSAIAPDGNTGFVLAAAHCAIFISLTGSIYGLASGNNWEKKN